MPGSEVVGRIHSPLSRSSGDGGSMSHRPLIHLGWRERVALPDLGIRRIRAKLDTGARSSALHVVGYRTFRKDGVEWVAFEADPDPNRPDWIVAAEARVRDERVVRASSGHEELRIVIRTGLLVGSLKWPIDVTLASRSPMRFRMLIGRQALRGRAVVDPGAVNLARRNLRVCPPDGSGKGERT